jgi:stage V sporulation protein G
MEITDVKVIPVDDEKLKAFVSIVFDQSFVVTDIKIIHGPKGLFVSMPSKKRKDGTFKDIAHPLNNQMRQYLEEKVLAVYRQQVGSSGPSTSASGAQQAEGGNGGGQGAAVSGGGGSGGNEGGGSSTEPHS